MKDLTKVERFKLGKRSSGLLSNAEREIAILFAQGMTSREIAASRNRSVATINRQIDDLHAKLGTRNKADVARWAIREGLVTA